jgi:hypothetical protein
LQALLVTASLKGDGPANNCQFRMILKIILKKKGTSVKQQASSLTIGLGYYKMNLERNKTYDKKR